MDLSNKQFGDYFILDRYYREGDKHILWNYICTCGERGYIRQENIKDSIKCNHKEKVVGKKYGRWTVLEELEENSNHKRIVRCQCSCDKKTIQDTYLDNLRSGKSKSCGCIVIEKNTTHGLSNDRLYTIHKGILARCGTPTHRDYKNYGARGICVYEEWKNDFMSFYSWAINNGYMENLTLERKDVNGNYEPNNCTWITIEEQQLNKRDTIYVEHDGIRERLSDLSKRVGILHKTLKYRLEQNYSYEELIKEPIYNRKEC